jgi:signal recognition particle subunit SRP54
MPGMGGGGMPNLGGMDMQAMMKMAQSMGMGGMPPGGPARR